MRVGDHCVDREGADGRQLLALHPVRGGLEPGSPAFDTSAAVVMVPNRTRETAHKRTVRELKELIAALDRRVPQVERVGEVSIARAAAELRSEALKRIEALERESPADVASVPGVAGSRGVAKPRS